MPLAVARRDTPRLILLDLAMPVMDGFTFRDRAAPRRISRLDSRHLRLGRHDAIRVSRKHAGRRVHPETIRSGGRDFERSTNRQTLAPAAVLSDMPSPTSCPVGVATRAGSADCSSRDDLNRPRVRNGRPRRVEVRKAEMPVLTLAWWARVQPS